MKRLIITIEDGKDTPRFEVEGGFPVDPVWILAFDGGGTAVSMFGKPQSYNWALSALRQIEQTFMMQAGHFERDDFGIGEEEDDA